MSEAGPTPRSPVEDVDGVAASRSPGGAAPALDPQSYHAVRARPWSDRDPFGDGGVDRLGGERGRRARRCSTVSTGESRARLKGTSRFGAELDSLADFVDFGVAPALVLYVASLHAAKSFGWVAALLFAMACALRLARFNVMIDEDQPAWRGLFFVGMPAPAGAIVGLLPIYLHYAFGLGQPTRAIRRGRKPVRAGGGAF